MIDSGSLPTRTLRVETDDPQELAEVQPERRRRFDQLGRGRFRGDLDEMGWGAAALQREHWSCGVRVRCDRPIDYVAFGVIDAVGDVRWCGAALAPGDFLRVEEPWELTSSGPLDLAAFAVDRARLREVEDHLAGGARRSPPAGNSRGRTPHARQLSERLRGLLAALRAAPVGAVALAAAEADLLHLAASLRRDLTPGRESIEPVPASARRRTVRRVEEYLDAHGEDVASVATLCAVAEVSERTLEYAFREHLGVTPVRFLRLRRLNRVRRDLLDPGRHAAGTAAAARRAGVYDLGRFAGDYRRLFGELPSETLRRSRRRFVVGARGPSRSVERALDLA